VISGGASAAQAGEPEPRRCRASDQQLRYWWDVPEAVEVPAEQDWEGVDAVNLPSPSVEEWAVEEALHLLGWKVVAQEVVEAAHLLAAH